MFTLLATAVLVVAAWQLNSLALKAFSARARHSVPLLVHQALHELFAPGSRFLSWHFARGGLDCRPGSLDWRMLILCGAVTLWVGGFDVLYACQDVEFDSAVDLYSIPKRFGVARALSVARAMHILMIGLLGWLAWSFQLAWPAWVGIGVVAALLAYEHSLVKPDDLSKMNAAFFHRKWLY